MAEASEKQKALLAKFGIDPSGLDSKTASSLIQREIERNNESKEQTQKPLSPPQLNQKQTTSEQQRSFYVAYAKDLALQILEKDGDPDKAIKAAVQMVNYARENL